MRKVGAHLVCMLNVLVMSSYYALTKGALGHLDAVMFSCFQLLLLAPPALIILGVVRAHLNWRSVKRGGVLGICLCSVLVSLAVALSYTSATETAFFPCLAGLFAALVAWIALGERVLVSTWVAALTVLLGMALLMITPVSVAHWRGNLIALLAALAFTCYFFLLDRYLGHQPPPGAGEVWSILGIQLLVMAAGGGLVALFFGNWEIHPTADALWAVVAVATNVLVTLPVFAFLPRHMPPTSVAFISTLEPLFAAGIAFLYLGEHFPAQLYLGGGVVFVGVLLQAGGNTLEAAVTTWLSAWAKRWGLGTRATSSSRPLPSPIKIWLLRRRRCSSPLAATRITHRVKRITGDLPLTGEGEIARPARLPPVHTPTSLNPGKGPSRK